MLIPIPILGLNSKAGKSIFKMHGMHGFGRLSFFLFIMMVDVRWNVLVERTHRLTGIMLKYWDIRNIDNMKTQD